MREVCRTQQFVLGPAVQSFEEDFAEYVGARHGIGCASGTDALILALRALDIGEGDEVITTPFSFFATAGSIVRVGARPVFADIQPDTFNLDPAKVEEAITDDTAALLPVHLYGQCAAMEELNKLADEYDLAVITDACQAIGATRSGQAAGTMGDAAAFSFYPTKNLGGLGDGGMVTVESDELADRLRSLRVHGEEKDSYIHHEVGLNSRLDSLQAAALGAKLPHLDVWQEQRRYIASRYRELLEKAPVTLPTTDDLNEHTFHQYTIRIEDDRDAVRSFLGERDIGSSVFYPLPLSLQPCFKKWGYTEGDMPVSERASREVLSLPVFPGMTDDEIEEVAGGVREAVESVRSQA
jgi:dTDP-4-amino-4,6-dideoxygalactose transaminase